MWWVAVAWGQGVGPDGAPLEGELLDLAHPLGAVERPPAVGPRRALELEARALLAGSRATTAVDPSREERARDRLLLRAAALRERALRAGGTVEEEVALAWLLEDLSRAAEADARWRSVLAREPAGPNAAVAHEALADAAFRAGDFEGALAHHTAALPDPRVGEVARYLGGWTLWMLERRDEAAEWLLTAAHGRDPRLVAAAREDLVPLAATLAPAQVAGVVEGLCGADAACADAVGAAITARRP